LTLRRSSAWSSVGRSPRRRPGGCWPAFHCSGGITWRPCLAPVCAW
jgi:membrane-associated PAP2 superfamily phosphatase